MPCFVKNLYLDFKHLAFKAFSFELVLYDVELGSMLIKGKFSANV